MKLYSLIPAVVFSMAVLGQAQTSPDPQTLEQGIKFTGEGGTAPTKPALDANEAGFAKYEKALNSDGSMTIMAGTVGEMIAEIHWRLGRTGYWPPVEGSRKMEMPNLIFGKGAREVSVPGEVTLRDVTPVQALALVVAAAGCSFKPIMAPEETADQKPMIIGYKIELQPASGFGSTGGNPYGSSGGGSGTTSRTLFPTSATSRDTSIPRVRVVDNLRAPESPNHGPRTAVPSADPAANPAGMGETDDKPFVRVYAIGFIMTGTDKETVTKVENVQDLIRTSLNMAKLDLNPDLNIHQRTGALIVKATTAQHEIIEQAVNAINGNATQTAAPAK
ncbi:MAG: hypothetical protein ACKV19_05910 [Verrucomicrobiales bacterium]